MGVSKSEAGPGGLELLETLVSLTGLSEECVKGELDHILDQSGAKLQKGHEDLTLEGLREALMAYLESLHTSLEIEE